MKRGTVETLEAMNAIDSTRRPIKTSGFSTLTS